MGAVAVLHCAGCGGVAHRELNAGGSMPMLSACDCGGRQAIVRLFTDRRRRDIPVAVDRRQGDSRAAISG
jgi:hypothetical protein